MEEKEFQSTDKKYMYSSQNHTDFNTEAATRCKISLKYNKGAKNSFTVEKVSQDKELIKSNAIDIYKMLKRTRENFLEKYNILEYVDRKRKVI